MPEQLLSTDPAAGRLLSEDPGAGAASGGAWVEKPGLGKTWQPADGTPGVDRARADTGGIVGVDHDAIVQKVANWASTLRPGLQKPAAFLATLPADALASLAEMFSAPESAAAGLATPAMAAMDATGAALSRTGQAVTTAGGAAVRAGGAALETVDPDLLAIASPRAGAALKKVQQVREALKARAAAAPAQASAPIETAASVPAVPVATVDEFTAARTAKVNSLPDQKALNETALAARRLAYQASQQTTPAPIVKASGKMHFTAAEMKEFARLRTRGLSLADAQQAVQTAKGLAAKLGGATDAEVAAAVAHREATGAW